MSGQRIVLLLPPAAPSVGVAPLEQLDAIARRVAAFCEMVRAWDAARLLGAGLPTMALARFMGEEMPRRLRALGLATTALEGALCIGDPRVVPLGRLRDELSDLATRARLVSVRLETTDEVRREAAVSHMAELVRRLAKCLAVVQRLVIPLSHRRLSPREIDRLAHAIE